MAALSRGETPVREELARRDWIGQRLLALADIAAAVVALLVTGLAAGSGWLEVLASLVFAPIVLLASWLLGLHDREELLVHRTTIDEVPQLLQLATIFAFTSWLLSGPVGSGQFGRGEAVVQWSAFVIVAALGRSAARRVAARRTGAERCLVVASQTQAAELGETMRRAGVWATVVGCLEVGELEGVTIPDVRALIAEADVHRIVVVGESTGTQTALDLVRAAKVLGVRISLMPRLLEVVGSQVQFENVGGAVLMGVRISGLGRGSRIVKRAFDLAVAGMLTLVALPLFGLIALMIKLDSPGPVFYRQQRVGRRSQLFDILKFRTMERGAHDRRGELAGLNEADGLFKIADDPRVTRVGQVLRRTSFDELPQLINVLRGEMSIVGPRPLLAEEDELITGFDRRRLDLTPGMTGHWQILGSSRVPLHAMVKIDYLYVAGWTLWTDVKILLRTVPYVLSRRGM
ncbi:MAG: hypothetical protein QOG68_210 [Solirubrobacteraceae bacterium]|nr:hypothetical protein [Solirubrobacteraceae bacterium]